MTQWSNETIAISMAVAFFPIMVGLGALLDYARVKEYETAVQAALDAAVLSGGRDGSPNWTQIALNTFNKNLSPTFGTPPKPTFVLDPSTGNYTGSVTGSQPTTMLGVINISALNVTVTAAAVADRGSSFILSHKLAPTNLDAWSVSTLTGNVLLANATTQPAAVTVGQKLMPGDKIRTGQNSQALLVRGQETILIAPNSVIGIPTSSAMGMSTTINQWAGSILLAVERRNVKHFEVVTPYLTAVVRGTRFRVTVNQEDANVEVVRGQVEVGDFRSGQYALVMPGQSAKVAAKGPEGLSLNGSDALNPILRGPSRKSTVSPLGLSMFPSSERVAQNENPQGFGAETFRRFFGHADDRNNENENITFAIVFAFGVGVLVAFIVAIRRRRQRWG